MIPLLWLYVNADGVTTDTDSKLQAPLLSEQPPANRRDYMPTNVKNVNGKHIAGTTLLMALVVVTYGMYMSVDSPDDFVAWGGDDRLARRLDLDNCQPQNGKATPKGREIAGQVLGYISTVLYLNSRLPQVCGILCKSRKFP